MELKKRYKAVFFDLGGTLRIALNDEPLHASCPPQNGGDRRHGPALRGLLPAGGGSLRALPQVGPGENKESGDEELWCKWLLPDYDPVRIAQVCHELSFQYRQSKGRRVVVDGGVEVIRTLYERGYRLGIISNLIGETEVPDWLEDDGLDQYFSSVVLSSVCHLRKPCAEIYRIASEELGVDLADCVSVADNVKRDLSGAIDAGVGCNIIFRSPEKKHPVDVTGEVRPDAVISQFTELLDLLPPLN